MTDCHPSAFPLAVLAEATRISPHRRTSSDGICGDAAHAARQSDHNPDARGIPHAVDISQSTPGAPYWLPSYGVFDAHAYGFQIAQRMKAGTETRVKYLVSFFNGHDQIFDPAVSMEWRPNATGTEHASHLHCSFVVAAEDSVAPFFVLANNPPPQPAPPPVTTDLGDQPVKITDTTVNLDGQGNGYFDLPGVSDPAVLAWGVIGTPDPQGRGYSPIPRVAFTLHGHTDRFVIEGGAPNSRCSVRVTHT